MGTKQLLLVWLSVDLRVMATKVWLPNSSELGPHYCLQYIIKAEIYFWEVLTFYKGGSWYILGFSNRLVYRIVAMTMRLWK